MKKSVKNVLATLSVSTLIAGSSLPLMAADKPADKPGAAQLKENKVGKKCAGSTKPTAKVTENKAGKKCAGSKAAPAEKAAPSK
jgi:hypothetical protein